MAHEEMEKIDRLILRKIQRRINEIGNLVWSERQEAVSMELAETGAHLTLAEAKRLRYRRVSAGQMWGKPWGTGWFRLRFEVPRAFRGEEVHLLFYPQAECILFVEDEPRQALDANHREAVLCERAKGGESLAIYVEAGCNDAFGSFQKRQVTAASIAVFNRDIWDAWWDLQCLADMLVEDRYRNYLSLIHI